MKIWGGYDIDHSRSVRGFYARDVKAISFNGTEYFTVHVTIGDNARNIIKPPTTSFKGYKNIPVRVNFTSKYPRELSKVRMFVIKGKAFNNVPIMSKSQLNAPSGAILKTKLYDIQLSGCTAKGNESYSCSGAVVTPK